MTFFDPPDDRGKPTPPPPSKTPELAKSDPNPIEATSSDTNTKPPSPPLLSEAEDTPPDTITILTPDAPVGDVMDAPPPPREPTPTPQSAPEVPAYPAPLPDPLPTSAAQDKTDKKVTEATEEVIKEEEAEAEEVAASSNSPLAPPSTTNGIAEVEPESLSVMMPPCHVEAPLESPIAQPEELRLPNGLPLPAPQDPEVPVVSMAERDDSPIAEPDVSQPPVIQTSTAIAQEMATPLVQATPSPVDQPTPVPPVQEIPADPVVQEAPVQPEVHDEVPPVALDAKEDAPVPQSSAKEEKPSSAETVSITESTPETVPTPPTPSAEEREDTPPPQTVTPTLVETTMQGQLITLC